MTYKINGTELLIQPTSGRWLPRKLLGMTGSGHPIYSAPRSFRLTWKITTPNEYSQLKSWFDSINITGTVVAELPQFGGSSYTFMAYSGCTLEEPEIDKYFVEHHTDVSLIINNIRT